jgi:hypothetical protein
MRTSGALNAGLPFRPSLSFNGRFDASAIGRLSPPPIAARKAGLPVCAA